MVIWQNNYKEQLEKWERANSQALIELQNSSASLTTVAARTESFTNSANRLESLIQSLNQSYELMVRAQQQMEQSLKALADVPKIATDKFNEIATTISSCANDIRVSGSELTTTVQSNSTRVAELSRGFQTEGNGVQTKPK
jgi:translation initiation factor 2B subunit (eIF-2B alpha/beta/delta family)